MMDTPDTQHYIEQAPRDMPAADLDAVMAAAVFGRHSARARAVNSSWAGLGRITEHLRRCGYTLHFGAFEPSHLLWLKSLPGVIRRGEPYRRTPQGRAA
jgi:hypothetical protein